MSVSNYLNTPFKTDKCFSCDDTLDEIFYLAYESLIGYEKRAKKFNTVLNLYDFMKKNKNPFKDQGEEANKEKVKEESKEQKNRKVDLFLRNFTSHK